MIKLWKHKPKPVTTVKDILDKDDVKVIIDSIVKKTDEIEELIVLACLKDGGMWTNNTDMTREHILWLIETNKSFMTEMDK